MSKMITNKYGLTLLSILLIAQVATNRDCLIKCAIRIGAAPTGWVTGWDNARQHGLWNPKRRNLLVIPIKRFEIHEHGAAGVGDIGDVLTRQIPNQP